MRRRRVIAQRRAERLGDLIDDPRLWSIGGNLVRDQKTDERRVAFSKPHFGQEDQRHRYAPCS